MKRLFVLAALLSILVACAVANATPSYTGATGGIALPDVKTTPAGQLDVALDYQRQRFDIADEPWTARATYGVGTNSELGIKYAWQQGVNSPSLDNWGVNYKYVLPVKLLELDIAVGGTYAKYADLGTNQGQIYVVGGANVWQSYENDISLDVNLGINWTKFGTTGSDIERFRAFTVLDYKFRDTLHMVGEYQTEAKMDSNPLSSIGIRYAMDENFSWQFGFTNAFRGVTGGDTHGWFLGANYRFDRYTEK